MSNLALTLIFLYVAASLALHFRCRAMHAAGELNAFTAPKSRATYCILSCTWGLPMTLVGALCALCFVIAGKRPQRYGWGYCFELEVDFGLELGMFIITPVGGDASIKNHELGHSIQNIWLGIFMPLVVCIPSAVRYWSRYYLSRFHPEKKLTPYGSAWFEGTATASGEKFMARYNHAR